MRRTWGLVVAAVALAALVVAGFALARDGSVWDDHPGAGSMGRLMGGTASGRMTGGRCRR